MRDDILARFDIYSPEVYLWLMHQGSKAPEAAETKTNLGTLQLLYLPRLPEN
jgi:hypothetical protein